jgi:carboxymethylenebutenolidase
LRAKIPIEDSLLDAQAAIDCVKLSGKVGVVGYCWGGSLAFCSATRLRGLTCAVGYYGSQIVARAHEVPKVPTMLHFGDVDASIPLSDVEKIQQARPDVLIHVYPGRHGFNCDARSNYELGSAQIAIGRTLEFFWRHVG